MPILRQITRFRMKRLVLALLMVSTLPFTAAAQDVYKNLPGVKDPAVKKDVEINMVCSSQLVRRWPREFPKDNGLAYRTYSCEEGRISVGSNRPPNMIEYRKFKERY